MNNLTTKAKAVINSCHSPDHLESMARYVNLVCKKLPPEDRFKIKLAVSDKLKGMK